MKTFFISGRQTGKTHMAVYEFLKDPTHSIFIGLNAMTRILVNPLLGYCKSSCFTQHKDEFLPSPYSPNQRIHNIIIDDYLCFDNKNIERIYKQCKNFNGNIYIFSTPKKQFDKKLFEKIKQIKENNVKSIESFSYEDIEELYFNFITDPDCNIIFDETHSYFINEFIRKESENWVNNLGQNEFDTFNFGKYLKDDTIKCPKDKLECPYFQKSSKINF